MEGSRSTIWRSLNTFFEGPSKVPGHRISRLKDVPMASQTISLFQGKGEMEIYEVILKQGPARCDLHPITENHSDEDSDDDDGSDVHSQLDETSLDTSSAYGSAHSRLSTDHNFASSNRNRSGQSRAASRATEHSGTSLQMRYLGKSFVTCLVHGPHAYSYA